MRYRLMATYRGIPYEAGVGPTDSDIVLLTPAPPPGELGFESAAGQWRKRVSRDDIDALWEYRPVGRYRSQPCLVLDEIGDRLHIIHLGHDAYQAERLGYWQVDRGVYEVVVPRDEVTGLTEERVEHLTRRRTRPAGLDRPPASSPPLSPPSMPSPAVSQPPRGVWGEYEGWTAGPRIADHPPPQNGRTAAGPAPSQNGGATHPVADALTGSPQGGGEPPGTPWADLPDLFPPPRPLPKRRRADPGPAVPPLPDPPATRTPPAADAPAPTGTAAGGPGDVGPAPALPAAAGPVTTAEDGSPAAPAARDQPLAGAGGRRRRARVETRWVFRDLVDMAAISHGSYAVDEEVDGALCLIKTDDGYEVFSAIDGSKHEVRFFEDEEAAYFYLFGVLAAEAVRSGRLVPKQR